MADYQKFVQKNGQRKGQKYVIKTGASGLKVRVYESGDTAVLPTSRQSPKNETLSKLVQRSRRNPSVTNPYR